MSVEIDGFPSALEASYDAEWQFGDGVLTGSCSAETDLFVDPVTAEPVVNAPRLLGVPTDGDFQLSARVEVEFAATFDAGGLLLWAGDLTWAKLCFEYSPQGEPTVVSVVTLGLSDDANAFTIDGTVAWLRVSRLAGAYAFHSSTDGGTWHFVRHFSLGDAVPELGFEVQSPVGSGLTATFSEITYRAEALTDLRDGR